MTEFTHSQLVFQGAVGKDHHLEAIKEVLNERPSVGSDRHIAVEFSKSGLGYLSPIFTNVLLTKVKLSS